MTQNIKLQVVKYFSLTTGKPFDRNSVHSLSFCKRNFKGRDVSDLISKKWSSKLVIDIINLHR